MDINIVLNAFVNWLAGCHPLMLFPGFDLPLGLFGAVAKRVGLVASLVIELGVEDRNETLFKIQFETEVEK